MTARILDGKALAQRLRHDLAQRVAEHVAQGQTVPGLAVVLIGDHAPSRVYVRNKQRACGEVGIRSELHELPSTISQAALLGMLAMLNADAAVHGVLVQLPLPPHIDENAVIDAISPLKDIDAFHPENIGRLAIGMPRYLPCTPYGVQQLLVHNQIDPSGKRIVVLGRSNIVGKPFALMMMQKKSSTMPMGGDATVTVVHRQTQDIASIVREAEIVVAAIGSPRFVTVNMIQSGAVVIDVGTNSVDGKLVGDVDAVAVAEVASALSPVPGGVGPMTITMLLDNTLRAAQQTTVG